MFPLKINFLNTINKNDKESAFYKYDIRTYQFSLFK